jgi:rod shape determining protein RodA
MRILISLNVFLLSFIGLLFIYSAFSGQYDLLFKNPYAIKQMIFMIIGIVILNLFSGLDYNMVVRASKYFYWFGLIFLVLVLFVFPTVKGRWIRLGFISFQPSEFMKLIYILFISSVFNSYFKRRDKTYTFNIIKFIFKTGFLTFVPFFLILKQPDLGTSLVFIIIWLVILFFIGTGFYTILSITFFSVGAILGVFFKGFKRSFFKR